MFDPSAPHIIILLIVLVLLFGSSRLPGAARSLGKSMHIFKQSVQGLGEDEPGQASAATPSSTAALPASGVSAASVASGQDATQQQLQDLQRQVEELRRQSSGGNGTLSETQTPQPF